MASIIGLTGQTGAGKSTVLEMLEKKGAAVIDADKVAHDVADNELWCLVEIVTAFSCLVLTEKGKLDRKKLGKIVFADPKKLQTLNKIMFPYIKAAIERKVEDYTEAGYGQIVVDGATLIESKCAKMCDVLISVTAEKERRLERIIRRDGLSKLDAERRVSAQKPEEFYTEASDFVIKNDGNLEELQQKTEIVFRTILRNEHQKWQEEAFE